MAVLTEQRSKGSGGRAARPMQKRPIGMSRLRQICRLIRVILGWVPVTFVGLITASLLIAFMVGIAGPKQDKVLMALGFCGLAYQVIATVDVLVMGLWLRFRPQGGSARPIKAEVGKPFTTDFSPGWASWNFLTRIEITWKSSQSAVVRLISRKFKSVEEASAHERMGTGRLERQFVVGDIVHLACVRFVRGRDEAITILPSRGAVTQFNPSTQVVSGDEMADPDGKPEGELIEMRRYTAGDPLKLVLWKLYARTGRLMVRTPERSIARNEATWAFLVAGPGDEPSAGIARTWIESGGLGIGSAFGADGRPGSAKTIGDALERVVHSVGSREQGGSGLADFLDQASRSGVNGCLLFVPARPGSWLLKTIQAIGGRGGRVKVIVGVDGVNERRAEGRISRLLTRSDMQPGADPDEIKAVVDQLRSAGAEVTVIDRISGRMVHPEVWTR